jgi:hypothetical protein
MFGANAVLVSVIAGVFILWLFISEFAYWLQTEVKPQLSVDTSRGEKLRINFDITFHAMSCACTYQKHNHNA